MCFSPSNLGRKKYSRELDAVTSADWCWSYHKSGQYIIVLYDASQQIFFYCFHYYDPYSMILIRMCGKKSTYTDKICKKCWIIFKLYQHPHLPGKSSAFTGRSEQKHRCRHSVFTYYTICFQRADNIIILHCAFKSSCQQGNHLSFKILNQIFNLVVCKASVPVCWITYVNTSQIQTRFGDWKSINFIMASKKKKRKVFRANV